MTTTHLPKSAEAVQKALHAKGLELTVVEVKESARTAQEAASAIGCEVAQIVKSLLFCTENGKEPVLILASGVNRVNEKRIEQQLGQKIVKADPNFTRDVTGYAIGGVPPVGHKTVIEHIFIDEELLQHEKLWAAAGTPHTVFSFPSTALQELTGGKISSIKA